ncbi:MAG TPA: alpha/beta fold hydrolase, partial [bacterium]|nr:alpha/beta fold hydrolase [bacterium]
PQQGYAIEGMADDCAGMLRELGIARAHVFGVSMGGMIAQRLALRHPAQVHGLVLGCTYFGGREAVQAQPRILDLLRLMPNESMDLRQVAYLQEEALYCQAFRASQRPLLDCFFDLRMQNPTPLHAVLGQAQAIAAFDASRDVAGIRAPTLLLTGDSDVLIPPENSRLLAQRIPAARLVTIPQAAHEFWIEQPQATAQAVIPFLQGLA